MTAARKTGLKRPPYQRNDYLGCKRLAQMLDELEGGERYMNTAYRPGPEKEAEEEQ